MEKKEMKRNGWWVLGAAGLFLLSKGKTILGLLKLSKFGSALISMAVTVWAYTIVFPYQVAIGLVAMIFIHEMGHVIAAKRKKLPVSAPFFIPFIGAAIMMKRHPRDAATEAYIGIGGPVLGSIGALAAFLIGWIGIQNGAGAGWYVWFVIANIGFILNLFNLLPMQPLDGGRIASAVSRWLWIVGLIGGVFLILFFKAWILIIFWVLFALDLYRTYVKGEKKAPFRYTVQWEAPLQPLLEAGYWIPGEEHRRQLEFETYSTVEDETQHVKVKWESLGLEHETELPKQAIIHKVETQRIERRSDDEGEKLAIFAEVQGETYTNDRYYEVPPRTRLGFGLAYFGLAACLAGMIWLTMRIELPYLS